MNKQQVHASLIAKGSNFRRFALENNYPPRTVLAVVDRWAGKQDLPRGRLSFRILRDLSVAIGKEITPGITQEAA